MAYVTCATRRFRSVIAISIARSVKMAYLESINVQMIQPTANIVMSRLNIVTVNPAVTTTKADIQTELSTPFARPSLTPR